MNIMDTNLTYWVSFFYEGNIDIEFQYSYTFDRCIQGREYYTFFFFGKNHTHV